MSEREELNIIDFQYDLPDERIAKYPLQNRNESKLLIHKNGDIKQSKFSKLEEFLPSKSILVFNDTQVIAARLNFVKDTGANIEVFCLEPFNKTIEQALNETKSAVWSCMVGNLKKFKKDTVLKLEIANTMLSSRIFEIKQSEVLIQFDWSNDIPFSEILDAAGEIPLPPYLNRSTEEEDKTTYQTVYAKNEGAVAAPTAGLHFVDSQLEKLKEKGHQLSYLTLFVGAGTFKTVKTEKLVDHEMHKERIMIDKSTIENLADFEHPIISVGTTSLRSLESLYWLAVKMNLENSKNVLDVGQNDAYELPSEWTFQQACKFIAEYLERHNLSEINFYSSLFIMPSYKWKSISGLITNFHQPGSTLLALIASWIGEDWRSVYQYAMDNDFRFLSYGDSSLLLK